MKVGEVWKCIDTVDTEWGNSISTGDLVIIKEICPFETYNCQGVEYKNVHRIYLEVFGVSSSGGWLMSFIFLKNFVKTTIV